MTNRTDVATTEGTEVATGGEISTLVQLAITEKVPVEVLERLVALQERVTDRDAKTAFIQALAAFQDAVPAIGKNKTAEIVTRGGGRYEYSYATLDAIASAIRSLLTEHGLSYSWDSVTDSGTLTCICTLRHRDGHEVTSTFGAPVETGAKMSGAQATAATLTYARRQSLVSVLGLSIADEDTDAQGAPVEPITDDQLANLVSLMQEAFKPDEFQERKAKLLAFIGCELGELPASRYAEVMRSLERARAEA